MAYKKVKKQVIKSWVSLNPLEQSLQAKILRDLDSRGIFNFKCITANKRGIPDIIACINGKFVAIEVKRNHSVNAKANISHIQDIQISKIKESKGFACVVSSLEEYQLLMESFGIKVANKSE